MKLLRCGSVILKLRENEYLDYGYTNQYRLSGLEVCLEYT